VIAPAPLAVAPTEAQIRQARAQLLHERAIAAQARAETARAHQQAQLALQQAAMARSWAHAEALAQARAEAQAQRRAEALDRAQAQSQAQSVQQQQEQDWVVQNASGSGTKAGVGPPADNGRMGTYPNPAAPVPAPGPVDPNCTPHRGSLFGAALTGVVLGHVRVGGTNLGSVVQQLIHP
jgi:hypothetical protein